MLKYLSFQLEQLQVLRSVRKASLCWPAFQMLTAKGQTNSDATPSISAGSWNKHDSNQPLIESKKP